MSEYWNLKDKIHYFKRTVWKGMPVGIDNELQEEVKYDFYFKDDVETLRQKLIDDIADILQSGKPTAHFISGIKVIKIINKRFGVDKE